MQKQDVKRDCVVCACILNGMARAGEWQQAAAFLNDMPSVQGVEPDLVAFNCLLNALARCTWRQVHNSTVTSSSRSSSNSSGSSAIYSSSTRLGDIALQTVIQMRDSNITPDAASVIEIFS